MGKVVTGGRASIDFKAINFKAINARVDLRGLIAHGHKVVAGLGEPVKGGRWLCPYHNDQNPSLGVNRDGTRFKCWSCGTEGSALDWVMLRASVGIVEAAKMLDPAIGSPTSSARPTPPLAPRPVVAKPAKVEAWRDSEWQGAADSIVCRAEDRLWSREGLAALGWLRGRGLADHTIRMFRLGFIADEDGSSPLDVLGQGRRIWAPRGITIPWMAPGAWYVRREQPTDKAGNPIPRWVGVNVRRLMPDVNVEWPKDGPSKCMAFAGSTRGYAYPYDDPTAGSPVILPEGEIDALIAFQECGHILDVVSVGGANQTPQPEALRALSECSIWLIASDHDKAGKNDSDKWRRLAPEKCRRLQLTSGKDIGEFHEKGGNLRQWLEAELVRLGIDMREGLRR